MEKLFRIILSDSTGRKLKKEIAEVEANYGDGTEFYRQLTLAFESIKPALTVEQEQIYRYKLNRIMSIIYNDPRFGRFDVGGGGAGVALDDI